MEWFVRETLRQCNQIRVACGLFPLEDMPKGTPTAIDKCPVALALSNGVYASVAGGITLHFPENTPRSKLKAICSRFKEAGFYHVLMYHDVRWKAPPEIRFDATAAMDRFIHAFDSRQLGRYIKGAGNGS